MTAESPPFAERLNSLHTNAYDEAITTPTDESVRRAVAIQLIISKEWGLSKNENPNKAEPAQALEGVPGQGPGGYKAGPGEG